MTTTAQQPPPQAQQQVPPPQGGAALPYILLLLMRRPDLARFMIRHGDKVLRGMARHRVERLAGVLLHARQQGIRDPVQIKQMLDDSLADRYPSKRVGQTETSTAVSEAAHEEYAAAGVTATRWATADDERVCPACMGNELAGPVPMGIPYPSGVIRPPAHPNCRCTTFPATWQSVPGYGPSLPDQDRRSPVYGSGLPVAVKRFDPAQPRDEHGRWIAGGGVLDLYHRTSADRAQQILHQRRMTSQERDEYGRPVAFFSNREHGQAEGYGTGLVHVRLPASIAQLDDEFPSGEQHYRVQVRDIRPEDFVVKGDLVIPDDFPVEASWVMDLSPAERLAADEIYDAAVKAEKRGGNAQTLRDYWTHHGHGGPTHYAGADAIAWGTPGDFMRCVALVSKHMPEDKAKGYCNLRHHDALGYYPATHARMDRGKTATMPDGEAAWQPSFVGKVGPKGYIHGWIYVGGGSSTGKIGSHVTHPQFGTGTITAKTPKRGATPAQVTARFADGQERTFDYRTLKTEPVNQANGAPFSPGTGLRQRDDAPELSPDSPIMHNDPMFGFTEHAPQGDYKVSDEEMHAAETYVSPQGNSKINDALRAGHMPRPSQLYGETENFKTDVANMDSYVKKFTLSKPATVYRGLALTPGLATKLKPGAKFTDPAFVSTSSSEDVARNFATMRATGGINGVHFGTRALGGVPTVMRIQVPAGQHAGFGEEDIGEWVLPRGTAFQVNNVDMGSKGFIDVSVVPSGS